MPELPEVETIRRGLALHLPGRRIRRVEVRCPKLVVRPGWEAFVMGLTGQTWTEPDRLGKLLIARLQSVTLLVHLGMTGQLTFRDPARSDDTGFRIHPLTGLQQARQHAPDQHTHIVLHHDDGTSVCYRDIRKFGKWRLYHEGEPDPCPEIAALGPDPLTPRYTLAGLKGAVRSTSRPIKAALLDQSVICGLGNIYVDEALHRCGVRPTRRANRLTAREVARLYEVIPQILLEAIGNRGSSFSDYRDADGQSGSHHERLRVYGRHGQPCPTCATPLKRSTVAARTSSWCPSCQK